MTKDIAAIILAAGRGERMRSETPKVLHTICARPMLGYVLDLVKGLKIGNSVVVLGHKHAEVREFLDPGIKTAVQKKLLGTADAVKVGISSLGNFNGSVLVLYGDIPLLKKETIAKLLRRHKEDGADVTILTAVVDNPAGYGRVLRDGYSSICGIAEEKDANDFQKEIKEINTGIICFKKEKLVKALKRVKPNNRKKEYYLTDVIGILYKRGGVIDDLRTADIDEALGINSRLDLSRANKIMQRRINAEFMKSGITITDSDSTFISFDAKIGADTTIYPFTVIESNVRIGRRCSVGPFAHIREGSDLKDDVVAGNFLEIVRSSIGDKTWAKHFCYIGDSRIGSSVNIGAGTVTANFDGRKKNITVIKDKALIGSDTVLVAPVKIGRRAVTGAGSVVLKNRDVADGTIVAGVPAKALKLKR